MKKIEIQVFPERKTDRVKYFQLSLIWGIFYVVALVVALLGFFCFSPLQMIDAFTDAGLQSVNEQNNIVKKEMSSIAMQIDDLIAKVEKLHQLRDDAARLGGLGVEVARGLKHQNKKSYENLADVEMVFRQMVGNLEKNQKVAAAIPSIRPLKNAHVMKNRFEMIYDSFIEQKVPHRGVDFIAQEGDTVVATGAGIVGEVRESRGFGLTMKLNHAPKVQTFYAHLGTALVAEGSHVNRGDPIAIIGSGKGKAATTLHYEIRLKNVPVNPEEFFITK